MAVVVGVTGGIATGKTTVVEMFRELTAETASADVIAREVLAPGQPATLEVIREFGPDVVDETGVIDRKKLGDRVFTSPDAREILNRITHPRIVARVQGIIDDFRCRRGNETGAVLAVEIPLLFECGLSNMVDFVVVVAAEQETLISRLMSRGMLSEEAAALRLSAQLPLEEKIRQADCVIWTDQGLESTKQEVEQVYRRLQGRESEGV